MGVDADGKLTVNWAKWRRLQRRQKWREFVCRLLGHQMVSDRIWDDEGPYVFCLRCRRNG